MRIFLYARNILFLLFFSLTLLVHNACGKQSLKMKESTEQFTDYIDSRIHNLMEEYTIPGISIALIQAGKTVWSGSYGYADRENHIKMTPDAVYRVESLSKPITAWGVMKLFEEGLIDLDTPVEEYLGNWKLPDSKYAEHEVTIRRLLSHNAGMALGTIGTGMEYSVHEKMPALREVLLQETKLYCTPGSGFRYSNSGFNLLELVIEEISSQKFSHYMEQKILMPLKMSHSSFSWNKMIHPLISTGYDLHNHAVPVYRYPVKGAGGLFASLDDICKFVSAGMIDGNKTYSTLLPEKMLLKLYTPQVALSGIFSIVADAYGLGYFIEYLSDGHRAVWHGGQGHGWMSHFHFIPETGDGIVILTNSQRSWPVMAYLLNDWAKWNGFKSVKMGKIIYGIVAMKILIVLIVSISLWLVYRLTKGIYIGKRRFAPLVVFSRKVRFFQITAAVAILLILAWCVAQPYLMLSSVFPVTTGWMEISLFVLAIIMLIAALFPYTEVRQEF